MSLAATIPADDGGPLVTPHPRLRLHRRFHSVHLPDDRDVMVYLPPEYDAVSARRFPVLYMHDGQNLFDPRTSFIPGRTWQVRETADSMILAEDVEPLIIVGIHNAGERRLSEYTHTRDWKVGGGSADAYGRLLTRELLPFVDAEYRTLTGPENTGMGGSSLGGLVTMYLGLRYASIFGKLAVMSPSVWWDHKSILAEVNEYEGPPWPRIWLDVGEAEGARVVSDANLLHKKLALRGWRDGATLHYERVDGGTHDETAWAARMGPMLRFLFPARPRDRGSAGE
ncbi:MAG TPA: alpha/beta hydrolase-fold protein [Acidisarcina sp.]